MDDPGENAPIVPALRPTVLVVDDERSTRDGLQRALREEYDVLLAESAARALAILAERPVDAVLTDLRMPGMTGLELIERILQSADPPVCIMLTAYGSVETAVEAMKRGAYDYLTKPVDLDRLELLLRRALATRRMEIENRRLREQLDERFGLEKIVGRSAAMQKLFDVVRAVAPSRATVLLEGESGTGKELVAHAIHRLSPRAQAPFIAVHSAALAPALLESELFGHEKGAFTGAHERRKGRFELADGGTLFLDEIGEVDPALQVKVLRVLEERAFERVGGQHTLHVDVRLVAATNQDLAQLVSEGKFREDLYYRLDVVRIRLPPLRERREDIPLLVWYYVRQFSDENAKQITGIESDAMAALTAHDWPGNVRQLRNCVERMVVLGRAPTLKLDDLPEDIARLYPSDAHPRALGPDEETQPILNLDEAERRLIAKALAETGGNRTEAARKLGISRRTLHRKLRSYELEDA